MQNLSDLTIYQWLLKRFPGKGEQVIPTVKMRTTIDGRLVSAECDLVSAHFEMDARPLAVFPPSGQLYLDNSYWRLRSIDYPPSKLQKAYMAHAQRKIDRNIRRYDKGKVTRRSKRADKPFYKRGKRTEKKPGYESMSLPTTGKWMNTRSGTGNPIAILIVSLRGIL